MYFTGIIMMITKNKGKKVEQLVQVLLSPLSKKMVRIYTSTHLTIPKPG